MPHNYKTSEGLTRERVKFIKNLRLKKHRIQENCFFVEGNKNVKALLASSYVVTMLLGTHSFLKELAPHFDQRIKEVFEVNAAMLNKLSALENNNMALAVALTPPNNPFFIAPNNYALILDHIQDPGNLGTILRIAAWYGFAGVICSKDTVELYNPKVIQASMGAFLQIPIYYTDLVAYLAKCPLPIIGAFTQGENLHGPTINLPSNGLVVIGNEARGINKALYPYIQKKVTIPKYGKGDSLNAAIAAAVICDQLKRIQNNT